MKTTLSATWAMKPRRSLVRSAARNAVVVLSTTGTDRDSQARDALMAAFSKVRPAA